MRVLAWSVACISSSLLRLWRAGTQMALAAGFVRQTGQNDASFFIAMVLPTKQGVEQSGTEIWLIDLGNGWSF